MDTVKKKKSLKWDFVKYFSICIILILAGSLLLGSSAEKIFSSDASRYALFIGDDGTVSIITKSERIPKNYILFLDIVNLFRCIAIPLWSLLCVVVCGIIFYHRKIEKPISILLEASENISNNRLDFSVEVPEKNEFGELCLSFEKMRVALKENNIEMWRQVEERKRLNAAFSHDLRTPLTVLKGQSEILSKYVPKMSEEKIIETAETMKRHIIRLETYVNTMNDLQRSEDVEVKKELVDVKELEHQMRITGAAVCKGKEFVLYQNIFDVDSVKIDTSIAMQVYENLLSNAVRYAKRKIEIAIDKKDSLLLLNVVDDGAGFTAKDLSNAMKPFYKAENEINNEHFGMGLNICKMLCEKHGGYLQISNENGAKAVAAFKE
ncbi:MAG: ATP-binding protein [Lachnospiraceae bacterium]